MYQDYQGPLECRPRRAYSTVHVEHVVRFLDRVNGHVVDTAGDHIICVLRSNELYMIIKNLNNH